MTYFEQLKIAEKFKEDFNMVFERPDKNQTQQKVIIVPAPEKEVQEQERSDEVSVQ